MRQCLVLFRHILARHIHVYKPHSFLVIIALALGQGKHCVNVSFVALKKLSVHWLAA